MPSEKRRSIKGRKRKEREGKGREGESGRILSCHTTIEAS